MPSLGTGRPQANRLTRAAGLAALVIGLLGAPAGALADSWAPGPMSVQAHPEGVSAELANGSVFVAGGDNTTTPMGELLAADGTSPFTPAGTMQQERIFAAGALLPGDDVLIAGGDKTLSGSTPVPKTAEVWNPNTDVFTATGVMNVSRQVFTVTTLPNGQALAVGGSPYFATGAGSRTAELYNPATGNWTLTGSMPAGRLGHTATLLADCRVLIVGDNPTAVTYDYVTGRFSTAGSEGSFQRSYHTATLLASGKVLIAGGETISGQVLSTASVWNPATGKFTPTANNMPTPHSQGFAARLPDGRVVVGGGFSDLKPQAITNKVDIYNPATNRWSVGASLPMGSTVVSPEAQTLQDGDVVVMGIGPLGNSTAIYTPSPLGPPVSPPAQNCLDLTHPFALKSVTVGSSGALKVTASAPPGTIVARAIAQTVRTSTPRQWFADGSARLTVTQPGTFPLTVAPSQRAQTLLRSGHSLRVKLTVRFRPQQGKIVTKMVIRIVKGS